MSYRTILLVTNLQTKESLFWTGSGLGLWQAESFSDDESALGEWNEYSESYPGWEVQLVQVTIEEKQ